MVADMWTDENGEFELEIVDMRNGKTLGRLYVETDPNTPLQIEYIKGLDAPIKKEVKK